MFVDFAGLRCILGLEDFVLVSKKGIFLGYIGLISYTTLALGYFKNIFELLSDPGSIISSDTKKIYGGRSQEVSDERSP